jgi:hypothetical protein
LDRDRLESNRTPRFRADETGDEVTVGVMKREGFSILESCMERSISKNSVFEGLNMRKFADNHEETSAKALSREETFFTEFVRRKK